MGRGALTAEREQGRCRVESGGLGLGQDGEERVRKKPGNLW